MLKIKGLEEMTWTTLPTPSDVSVSYFDISDAERGMDGTMHIDFIARKRRIDIVWNALTQAQKDSLLNAIHDRAPLFYIQLIEESGTVLEMKCYVGNRKMKMGWMISGQRYWTDITIAFVEA